MVTLIDALESFLRYHKLPRETTCFWLFDLCVRLNERGLRAAQKHVEFVHAEVGRTVMLLDPWHELIASLIWLIASLIRWGVP